ncbi:hypothetical protein [Phenylobacterium sp.]|uniref:hypothetical protein n=1 Tax=Phenylobacterium sp. TaxID=1871053 RepID=UPI0030F41EAB
MRLPMIVLAAALGLAACQKPAPVLPATPAAPPLTEAQANAARETLMAHEGEWDCTAPALFDHNSRRLLVEGPEAFVVSPAGFPGPAVVGGATGATVFRKSGSGWAGYMIDPISEVAAVRYGPAGLYLITKVTREGGGPLGIALLPNGGGGLTCVGLASPESLNAPAEHPEFFSLSLDRAGKGSLVAKADREDLPVAWFRYDTTDAGATWTDAKAISGPEGTDLPAPDQTKVPAPLAREIAGA